MKSSFGPVRRCCAVRSQACAGEDIRASVRLPSGRTDRQASKSSRQGTVLAAGMK